MRKYLIIGGLAFLLAGCEMDGKVTGGGTMNSAGGDGKAIFTFNGQRCPDQSGVVETKGKVVFHDKAAIDFEGVGGVDIHGTMINTAFCGGEIDTSQPQCRCSDGNYQIEFDYRSTNKNASGEGQGIACVRDLGEGRGAHGTAVVQLESGPYQGYANVGALSGNVQAHECPGEES